MNKIIKFDIEKLQTAHKLLCDAHDALETEIWDDDVDITNATMWAIDLGKIHSAICTLEQIAEIPESRPFDLDAISVDLA